MPESNLRPPRLDLGSRFETDRIADKVPPSMGNDAAGFPWATGRWDGSFVPFPRTDMERQASGDPRPSLQARYANRAAYEAKVRSAAAAVVAQGFLLPEEVDALVDEAGSLYDRIMAHDPADHSCDYLFSR